MDVYVAQTKFEESLSTAIKVIIIEPKSLNCFYIKKIQIFINSGTFYTEKNNNTVIVAAGD